MTAFFLQNLGNCGVFVGFLIYVCKITRKNPCGRTHLNCDFFLVKEELNIGVLGIIYRVNELI